AAGSVLLVGFVGLTTTTLGGGINPVSNDSYPATQFLVTGRRLLQEICKQIYDWGLEPSKLVGFGFDGASTMLGSKNGVAMRLKRSLNPFLTITHCVAHRKNLASLAAAKDPTCKVVILSFQTSVHLVGF
ncbi:hypothetical protein R1flu_021728, partial [Riccia fluitans]